ncbi:hypothetical protein [Aliiroseovarius crassostreae]|uniref:hypothetical protein n=1 Tax=Aliiroseovarius crassostreae TaxID=154981 RepID=UPI0021FB8CCD|nr:hypothetical protein [Aliiroseovarius crassostreae]UWQ07129.1 hypothetical protein K3X25_10060 [Aliiroseovarius crassostreae]
MSNHVKMQNRLRSQINNAILDCGKVEGSDVVALTNTDVVEALLEVTGVYASIHGFETYTPTDLAFKHAMTIQRHIEQFRRMREQGKMPVTVIPRNKVN